MGSNIRDLIAVALYSTKAHDLPSVCERYGLGPGTGEEAFASKMRYVMARLNKLPDDRILPIAKAVLIEFPLDELQAVIEQAEPQERLVSKITRHNLLEALDEFSLNGKRGLFELLRKYFPGIDTELSFGNLGRALADDIYQHCVLNDDWSSSDYLEDLGFLTCSQMKLFEFLEDIVHPLRRDENDQKRFVARLNPILERDGYEFARAGDVSGYPIYKIQNSRTARKRPADALISEALMSFDEGGVHAAWQKSLTRRSSDPEGAITAARALLETVCKHILEEAGVQYGGNDDLPKLYGLAAECLNLAPSQHSEPVFKAILGNCQAVVSNLAAIRNKLGDSHGQGKRHSKPLARHAELAVNLAGSVAMFLISTWHARSKKP